MSLARMQQAMANQLGANSINPINTENPLQAYLNNSVQPLDRLRVYQNNTIATRINALETIFSHSLTILGNNYFRQIAKQFVVKTPSLKPDLNLYGASFAPFLGQEQPKRPELESYSYLEDLARLEWFKNLSYYTYEHKQFNYTTLSTTDEHRQLDVILLLAASTFLLTSPYPLHALIALNERTNTIELEIDQGPYFYAIYTKAGHTHIEPISYIQHTLLEAIENRARFQQLALHSQSANIDLGMQISAWITKEFINDYCFAAL